MQSIGYTAAALVWAIVVPIACGYFYEMTDKRLFTVVTLGLIWPVLVVSVILIAAGKAILKVFRALFNLGVALAEKP